MMCPIASLREGTFRSFHVLGVLLRSQHRAYNGGFCCFSVLMMYLPASQVLLVSSGTMFSSHCSSFIGVVLRAFRMILRMLFCTVSSFSLLLLLDDPYIVSPHSSLLLMSDLYRMHSESRDGPCFDLESTLSRFCILIALLIATSVCFIQRSPLSKWIPKCFTSFDWGILLPFRNRSGSVCGLLCLVKLMRVDFSGENFILHILLHLLMVLLLHGRRWSGYGSLCRLRTCRFRLGNAV